MPRIIEIVLFLSPFVTFAAWRLLFPSPVPPPWLIYGLSGFVILMLLTLVWLWHLDAGDADQPYVPDQLQDGRAVPAHLLDQRQQGAPERHQVAQQVPAQMRQGNLEEGFRGDIGVGHFVVRRHDNDGMRQRVEDSFCG